MKEVYKENPHYIAFNHSYSNGRRSVLFFSSTPFSGNLYGENTSSSGYIASLKSYYFMYDFSLQKILSGTVVCSGSGGFAISKVDAINALFFYTDGLIESNISTMPFPYAFTADSTVVYPDVIPVDKVPEKIITNPDDSIPLDLDKVYLPDGTLDKGYVNSIVGEAVLNPPVEEDKPSDAFPWVPDIANPIKGILGLLGQLLEYLRGILQKLLDGTLAIPGFLSSILEFVIDICDAIIAFPATLEKLLMDLLDFAGIIAAIDAIAAFFVIDFSLVWAEIAPLQAELTGKFSDITDIIHLFRDLRAGNKVEAPSFTLTIPSVMGLGEIVIPFNFSKYSKAMETVRSVESVLFWFWFALAMFSMIRVRFHVD